MNSRQLFSEWLQSEMSKRGLSIADVARSGKISPGALGNVLRQTRNAGPDLCTGIANAFGLPPELVFQKAGLLPPQKKRSETINEILHIMQQLDDDNQQDVADYVRLRLMRQEKKKGGQARRAQDTVPAKR